VLKDKGQPGKRRLACSAPFSPVRDNRRRRWGLDSLLVLLGAMGATNESVRGRFAQEGLALLAAVEDSPSFHSDGLADHEPAAGVGSGITVGVSGFVVDSG
jgi:hypothetical protein